MSWYAIIPSDILARKDLTANHKLVMGVIVSLSKQKGHCFASNDYIAELIGRSSSLIRSIISDLHSMGLVNRDLLYKPNGQLDKRILSVVKSGGVVLAESEALNEPISEVKKEVGGDSPLAYPRLPAGIPPASPLAHNNKELIIKNNKVSNDQVLEKKKDPLDGFEEFWTKYDKKVGKESAIKLWVKLKEAEKESILKQVEAYVLSKPEKVYRKDPERYLRHRVWEDELVITTQPLNEKKQNGIGAPPGSPAIKEIEIPSNFN